MLTYSVKNLHNIADREMRRYLIPTYNCHILKAKHNEKFLDAQRPKIVFIGVIKTQNNCRTAVVVAFYTERQQTEGESAVNWNSSITILNLGWLVKLTGKNKWTMRDFAARRLMIILYGLLKTEKLCRIRASRVNMKQSKEEILEVFAFHIYWYFYVK